MLRQIVLATTLALISVTPVFAQQVSVIGIVTDESKAVMPGVTVTATEVGTGRTYEFVTNERGEYRLLGMGPGTYNITADLSGFSTARLSNLEFLVGQNATVPITLKVATLEESVTVTSAAPLVDLRSAQISGNVDRRQMEELPLAGRDWLQLTGMVAGASNNTFNQFGRFQLNLDGQQITQDSSITGFGQPGLSRDAIAEYQVVTNAYDVSMGRSVGLEVQAISKSGNNNLAGSVYGFFRDDRLNSKDPFTNVVLPFQSQQIGGTFGGPIVRDKTHYFVSSERERNPNTIVVHPTALAPQQITVLTADDKFNFLSRIDHQFSNRDHLVIRGNYYSRLVPNGGITNHPSRGSKNVRGSYSGTINWTHAASGGLLHEVKVGYYRYMWTNGPMDDPKYGVTVLTPEYQFPGLTMGLNWNYYEYESQRNRPILRYDLSEHRGSHDLKVGADASIGLDDGNWPYRSRGQFFFSSLPPDAGTRFPLDKDATFWDFTGLDSRVIRFDQTYSNDWTYDIPRKTYSAWFADTWTVNKQLTLNLGIRYDLQWGDFTPPGVSDKNLVINNGLFTEDVGYRNDLRDKNNFGPRGGFAWNVGGNGDLVIRGGSGIFYTASRATRPSTCSSARR